MIKPHMKVICIKDYIIPDYSEPIFKKDEILSIKIKYKINKKNLIYNIKYNIFKYELKFYFYDESKYESEIFGEYFLTIGELREQRINEILND